MAKWWDQGMSDASQFMPNDPSTALQFATMPNDIVWKPTPEQQESVDFIRSMKGDYASKFSAMTKQGIKQTDELLSKVPGFGIWKAGVKAAFWPVDKLASGAYWLYSNTVSQPLSTAMLQAFKTQIRGDLGTLTDFDEWKDAYSEAENISPGQAAMNFASVAGVAGSEQGAGPEALLQPWMMQLDELNEDQQRQAERLLYDTEYWRDKSGWRYTVGSGASDFALAVGADPIIPVLKGAGAVTKAARHAKLGEDVTKADTHSKRMNEFFDWVAEPGPSGSRKSAYEISQHPIWGKGRRKNPEAARLSEVYATMDRTELPLLMRYNAGQRESVEAVMRMSESTVAQVGKLNENRRLVASVKFDDEMLSYFLAEERAGRSAPGQVQGIGGSGTGYDATGRLIEPPFPRPTEPGPRQSGWDAAYGHLADPAKIHRKAAGELLKQSPRSSFLGHTAVSAEDLTKVEQWRAGELETINAQLAYFQKREGVLQDLIGISNWGKSIEDFAPGSANMFGTMKQAYRLGPMGGSVTKMGDKAVMKAGMGRGNRAKDGGIASEVYRNGFFRTPIRAYHTFGERLPENFVNHVDDDAPQRVMDLLKQVRGMTPETRLGLVNLYSSAGDKVARSRALEDIHGAIIRHYGQTKGLNPAVSQVISDMIRDGVGATMMKLTGKAPGKQMFSAAEEGGVRADLYEDGEAVVVAPLAKTQLSQGDVLLPIREFERFIDRHSGSLAQFNGKPHEAGRWMVDQVDGLSKLWKAATLLRPGYVVRTTSEEAAASAVKFGLFSALADIGEGGWNFMRNRGSQVKAFIGKGDYASTVSGKTRLMLDDPAIRDIARKHGLEETRINLGKEWPIVASRISTERSAIKAKQAEIKRLESLGEDTTAIKADIDDHELVIREFSEYAEEILRKAETSKGFRIGESELEFAGQKFYGPFSKEWNNPIAREQISHEKAFEFLFARSEAVDMNRFIKSGNWVSLDRSAPNYMESWLGALNNQFRQDDVYRLVAEDPTLKKASDFLRTPEGKKHLSHLGPWARDPSSLLRSVQATLDKYLPRGTGLQAKLARGEQISEHELRAVIAEDDFPLVHGEEINQLTKLFSKETMAYKTDEIISKGFKLLGGIPSDILVRQPAFHKFYVQRMQEGILQHQRFRRAKGGDESMTPSELNELFENSAKAAKKDISQVVYDPTRTTATEALRFVSPFLSAHVDSLQRWGGLIAEKPQLLGYVSKIYNAPVAANLVTDAEGNFVDQTGHADIIDPSTGKKIGRKFVGIEERVLHVRLPWDTVNIKGREVPGGGTPIKIQAMNTILPGDPWFFPGTGPLVQMPASQIAKASPTVGDFLQWSKVLPYGPDGSFSDALLPKYMKAAYDAYTADDPGNEKFQQTWLAVYNKQVGEYNSGVRQKPVDLKEVDKEAKQMMFLKILEAWGSPYQTKATPLTGTPYQFYVDQYKKLKDIDPKTADDKFLATYGSDYASFTADLSKSIGVAPTIAAMTKSEEYKDLIDADPEMAAFIVGETYNGGGFSSSVYRKQMETMMGGKPMREGVSGLEAVKQAQTTQGWAEYLKFKGKLDAALYANGFRSYQQKGAEQFVELRNQFIAHLGSKFPEWEKDRGEINTQKIPSRIKFFEKAIKDPRIQSDPLRKDLPALDLYLATRAQVKAELAKRGASKLSFDVGGQPTGENRDLGYAWKNFTAGLVASNTQFQDIYNRYLENDDLQ